jgi:hypothetical protein
MKQSKPSSTPAALPRKTDRFALSGRAFFRGQGIMRWLLSRLRTYPLGADRA